MNTPIRSQRLIGLFAAALLFGLPLFPTALFLVWGALIALLALVIERTER
jgi:uncharacterized membrane protein